MSNKQLRLRPPQSLPGIQVTAALFAWLPSRPRKKGSDGKTPSTRTSGSRSLRLMAISFCTSGVAVAVKAGYRNVEAFLDLSQALVVRTEIVAPLGNTMRFVHHDIVWRRIIEGSHKQFIGKAFRRHIKETQLTGRPVLRGFLARGR